MELFSSGTYGSWNTYTDAVYLNIYLPSKRKIFDSFPWKKGGTT